MTIDGAMQVLLDVSGKQFKDNVELYGAVHTDELRLAAGLSFVMVVELMLHLGTVHESAILCLL